MATSRDLVSLGEIGQPVTELDTPALVVDLDRFEKNVGTMFQVCTKNGKDWRPHAKGHKSIDIARLLVKAGAIGVTVAKLGEAEVMYSGGVKDILIANQIAINKKKLERVAKLAKTDCNLIVTVDNIYQAESISDALVAAKTTARCIIEIDIGMGRAGVEPALTAKVPNGDIHPTLQLAQSINDLEGLQFSGVMGYEGHLLVANDTQDTDVRESVGKLVQTANIIKLSGLTASIVSCAGTGSMNISATIDGVTEIQGGGGIFSDMFYQLMPKRSDLFQSLSVLTTVSSRPTPKRVIVDAGRKTLVHWEGLPSMPRARLPEAGSQAPTMAEFWMLSAEHGAFDIPMNYDSTLIKIGDKLHVTPAYHDLTVCLHDKFYAARDGSIEAIWTIDARGRMD